MKKILFLYSEVMGYTEGCFKEFVKIYDYEVHCVLWDKNKLTPFIPKENDRIFYYKKSKFNDPQRLISLITELNPSLIYLSGWNNKEYIRAIKKLGLKKKVVMGMDNQYTASIRQIILILISRFYLHSFTQFIWVPGIYQYEYARRLKYKKDKIFLNMYSANVELFDRYYHVYREMKEKNFPRTIIFVGRFHPKKGLDILIEAFQYCNSLLKSKWKLMLTGNRTFA